MPSVFQHKVKRWFFPADRSNVRDQSDGCVCAQHRALSAGVGHRRAQKGFSLFEVVIATVLAGVLGSVAMPKLTDLSEPTREVVDLANERQATNRAQLEFARKQISGRFNFDISTGDLTNEAVSPYGQSKAHKGQYLITLIEKNGSINTFWSGVGENVYQAFNDLVNDPAFKGKLNWLANADGIVSGSSLDETGRKSLDSEGRNANACSWGCEVNKILAEKGVDLDNLSYAIKAKPGANLNQLKEGDVIIYTGDKITTADVGKTVTVTAYDVATGSITQQSATVVSKSASNKSYPVFQF